MGRVALDTDEREGMNSKKRETRKDSQPTAARSRQRTEALALAPFQARLDGQGAHYALGQGASNRISLALSVYYQFGDLRVETPSHWVVVEVESAGGVTNLAKYWEAIASGRVLKPIRLLHIFIQKSERDYASHLLVWAYLNGRMQEALGASWMARCVTVRDLSDGGMAEALSIFDEWIKAR